MKRTKIFLASLTLLVAIGSAFAFKAVDANDVYYKNGSDYILKCSLTETTSCVFAATTGTSGLYYTQSGGSYTQIADNTSLFEIPQ